MSAQIEKIPRMSGVLQSRGYVKRALGRSLAAMLMRWTQVQCFEVERKRQASDP